MALPLRLGAFSALARAFRAATRPGSPGFGERFAAVPRLLRATMAGEYTGTSRGRLILALGGILYIVSPVDVVPEALLAFLGLADDALVASWVATTLINESESFLAWERSTGRPGRRGGRPGTVPGHVVR